MNDGSNKGGNNSPRRFVGLHSHSTYSTFDAIGRPQDHIDFARKNGMDALALTDHGNMNGFSHQHLYAEKLRKDGINFKAIYGVEAYFVPSLSKWRELYEAQRGSGTAVANNKGKESTPGSLEAIGNELAKTEEELQEISEIKAEEAALEDDSGGTIVENEEESKGTRAKFRNPLYQRNHLVLLAKNDAGLKSLFRIVSDSAADGFYRYPRVDLDMLKKHSNGNIIALSACIAGYPAKIVFDHQKEPDHNLWVPNDDNLEEIQAELALAIAEFQEVLGKENYYLEIQFNRLGAQHLVNQHLIEASKRTGCPLVVTCDAHYSDPSHWREREIYKMMGMLQFLKPEEGRKPLPEKVEELKCELYPKNAEQVWASYKNYCHEYGFYDDQVIMEAIERTHDIAHQQIASNIQPDRRVKLPSIEKIIAQEEIEKLRAQLPESEANDEDMVAFKEIKKLAIEGLKFRRLHTKQTYIDRLKYELEVIKGLKFAKYFLTYYHIMRVCSKQMLIGNARGCFLPGTRVKMANGMMVPIESVQIGDKVIDAYGNVQNVENTLTYDCNEDVIELVFDDGKVIRCTKDHKFLTTNRGWVPAQELTEEDDVKDVAQAIAEEAEKRCAAREELLRQLGFEELTVEQCKKNLALNIALREWPKED